VLIFLFSVISPSIILSQQIIGLAKSGGEKGGGVIYSVDIDSKKLTTLKNFETPATSPEELTELPNGYLYGVTRNGGIYDYGVVYRIKPDGTDYSILHHFAKIEGTHPRCKLLFASDGHLYGTTTAGGLKDEHGSIFRISPDGSNFAKIIDLDLSSGNIDVNESLIEGLDGFLYGCAARGGKENIGTIFKLRKDGSEFSKIYDFAVSKGGIPEAGLLQLSDGTLFGTTRYGGNNGFGTIFKINPDGSGYKNIHHFTTLTGIFTTGPLSQLSDGRIIGATLFGGSYFSGLIFTIKQDGSSFSVLYNFNNTSDRYFPASSVKEINGYIYGTANGPYKLGMDGSGFQKINAPGNVLTTYGNNELINLTGLEIFKITDDQSTSIFNFNFQKNVYYPSQIIQASSSTATIYGLTAGGLYDKGAIFKVDDSGYKTIYNFNEYTPTTNLLYTSNYIYGLAYYVDDTGHTNEIIFRLNTDGSAFTVIKTFLNSINIQSGGFISAFNKFFILDREQTPKIYSMNLDGSDFKELHTFTQSEGRPRSHLVEIDGFLYGTTGQNDTNTKSTIYRMDMNGNNFSVVYNFLPLDEYHSHLHKGPDGFIYWKRMTSFDTYSGALCRVKTDGTQYSVVHNFDKELGFLTEELSNDDVNIYGVNNLPDSVSNAGILYNFNTTENNFDPFYTFETSYIRGFHGDLLYKNKGITSVESANVLVATYPNPCTNYITVSSPYKITSITLTDSKGSYLSSLHESEGMIKLPDIQSGIYLINIEFSNKTRVTKRIVKSTEL
jgi:uncharacterized repeat protein (TIGR03803 family)